MTGLVIRLSDIQYQMSESPDWRVIGNLLKALRRQRRITYRELASRSGLGRGTILRIEAGKPSRRSTLQKIELALNLSPGVLTHSMPLETGSSFVQDPLHEFIHVRVNPKCTRRLPEYSQETLRDPAERRRIGKLGFLSCFQWESDLGLAGATMRGTLMELHDETPPGQHEGEEMVFGVQGTSLVRLEDGVLVVKEHQMASFWPSQRHSYAPDTSSVPSLILSVRIDAAKRSRGR